MFVFHLGKAPVECVSVPPPTWGKRWNGKRRQRRTAFCVLLSQTELFNCLIRWQGVSGKVFRAMVLTYGPGFCFSCLANAVISIGCAKVLFVFGCAFKQAKINSAANEIFCLGEATLPPFAWAIFACFCYFLYLFTTTSCPSKFTCTSLMERRSFLILLIVLGKITRNRLR